MKITAREVPAILVMIIAAAMLAGLVFAAVTGNVN